MTEKQPCVQCQRSIDSNAKLCVYCNWDQSQPPQPKAEPKPGSAAAYVPPPDHRLRNRILGAIAFVVLVIGAFMVGAYLHRPDSSAPTGKPVPTPPSKSSRRTTAPAPSMGDVTVIASAPGSSGDSPAMSIPPNVSGGLGSVAARNSDPTASTSQQMAAANAAAGEPRGSVDPRTLRGPASDAIARETAAASSSASPRRSPAPAPLTAVANVSRTVVSPIAATTVVPATAARSASSSRSERSSAVLARNRIAPGATGRSRSRQMSQDRSPVRSGSNRNRPWMGEPEAATTAIRTRPVPLSQPLPTIHLARNATARLDLTVGPDGSVRDVHVLEALPGETARLIAAVQNWRFRPGTENGTPATSHFTVDISFHGNE